MSSYSLRFAFLLLVVGWCVFASSSAKAQLPGGKYIFDEFSYNGADYNEDPAVRSGPEGSLFGVNEWTVGEGQTEMERAWYRYDWFDLYYEAKFYDNSEFNASPSIWNNGLEINLNPGEYGEVGEKDGGKKVKPPYVISGFAARRGIWMARINFDDLNVSEAHGGDEAILRQAFWLHTPYNVTDSNPYENNNYNEVWDEVDFEYTNSFNFTRDWDNDGVNEAYSAQEWPYMSSGTITNGSPDGPASNQRVGYTAALHAPTWPDGNEGGDYTCKYLYDTDSDGDYEVRKILSASECGDLIGGNTYTPAVNEPGYSQQWIGNSFWVWVMMKHTGNEQKFQIARWGDWGIIQMQEEIENSGEDKRLTTQPMATHFSQRVNVSGSGQVDRSSDLEIDWFYYTPNTNLNFNEVRDSVLSLRRKGYKRVNTTDYNLSRPYKVVGGSDWPPMEPTNDFDIQIDSPQYNSDSLTWTVRPKKNSARAGRFRIDWQYTKGGGTVHSDWDDFSFKTPKPETIQSPEFCSKIQEEDVTVKATWTQVGFVQYRAGSGEPYEQDPVTVSRTAATVSLCKKNQSDKKISVSSTPSEYALHQNYPNPVTTETQISFALPKSSDVELVVYNILGQEVDRPVDGTLDAGYHNAMLELEDLPAGVYIYRLQAGSFSKTRKLTVAK